MLGLRNPEFADRLTMDCAQRPIGFIAPASHVEIVVIDDVSPHKILTLLLNPPNLHSASLTRIDDNRTRKIRKARA